MWGNRLTLDDTFLSIKGDLQQRNIIIRSGDLIFKLKHVNVYFFVFHRSHAIHFLEVSAYFNDICVYFHNLKELESFFMKKKLFSLTRWRNDNASAKRNTLSLSKYMTFNNKTWLKFTEANIFNHDCRRFVIKDMISDYFREIVCSLFTYVTKYCLIQYRQNFNINI